mgnify:CR=1 FL=1
MYFDIIEGNVNHLAIGLFDQPEFNEAGDVGMVVGVVAGSGLGEGVDAAWAVPAQGIQQVEAGRGDFGEELASGLEAGMKVLIAASGNVVTAASKMALLALISTIAFISCSPRHF